MAKEIEEMSPRELFQTRLGIEWELSHLSMLGEQDEIPEAEFPKYQARWDQLQEHRRRVVNLISVQALAND